MTYLIQLESGSYPGKKCYIRMTPYGVQRVLIRSHASGWPSESGARQVLTDLQREACYRAPEQMSPSLCERLRAAKIISLADGGVRVIIPTDNEESVP